MKTVEEIAAEVTRCCDVAKNEAASIGGLACRVCIQDALDDERAALSLRDEALAVARKALRHITDVNARHPLCDEDVATAALSEIDRLLSGEAGSAIRHGTRAAYDKAGCRCVRCVAANSAYFKARRAKQRVEQGGRG